MLKRTIIMAACLALAAAPAASNAQELVWDFMDWATTDVYVGFSTSAGLQSSDADVDEFAAALTEASVIHAIRAEDGGVGWRMYAGKRLHPNFAVEAGYAKSGKVRVSLNAEADDRAAFFDQLGRVTPVAPAGLTLGAVSEWSFADLGVRSGWAYQAFLVGRLGLLAWRTEASYVDGLTIIRHSDSGVGLHAGFGGGWWLTEHLSGRLEWEVYSADTRVRAVSLGIVYSF